MRSLLKISAVILLLATVSCRELPDYLVGSDTLARVGREELTMMDIMEAMPKNLKLSGEDSVAYIKNYVDRWVVRQLKIEEAAELFSSPENDIEKLVETYRQSLLTSKVDQYYIDRDGGGAITDEEISAYYNSHKSDFTLDRTLVKGRILRFDASFRQSKKLKEQMQKASSSQSADKSFVDLCDKNGFSLIDHRSEWVSFTEFLTNLPITQSQDYEHLLDKTGVQEMKESKINYYFDFSSVCRKGNVAPLEVVAENIRRILITQRHTAIIKQHEESILRKAQEEGHARIYETTESDER